MITKLMSAIDGQRANLEVAQKYGQNDWGESYFPEGVAAIRIQVLNDLYRQLCGHSYISQKELDEAHALITAFTDTYYDYCKQAFTLYTLTGGTNDTNN